MGFLQGIGRLDPRKTGSSAKSGVSMGNNGGECLLRREKGKQ